MGFSSEYNGGSFTIPLRTPLKPIYTTSGETTVIVDDERVMSSSSGPTTPTSEGSRIPLNLPCPPPPRKRKTTTAAAANNVRCKNNSKNNKLYNGKREFFITPPDLEAVFIRRHNVGC